MVEKTKTTIRDVAAEAGVSIATVSRVLSGKPHIRDELRVRVQAAVDKLGYRPNRAARRLRSQRSGTLGLIVSDIRNPFFAAVSRVVEETAAESDYSIFLCNAEEDPDREQRYLEILREQQVEGVLLSPTPVTAAKLPELLKGGPPTVVLDREVDSDAVDQIGIDNERAAAQLTERLFAEGCQRVAAFFGDASSTGLARHQGFLRAHNEAGRVADPELVNFVAPYADAGCRTAEFLLNRHPDVDGVLASNGALAGGVLKASRLSSRALGRDLSFACFDRPDWIDILGLPVHLVQQPTGEIGKIAVELLLKRIKEPGRPGRRVLLAHELSSENQPALALGAQSGLPAPDAS